MSSAASACAGCGEPPVGRVLTSLLARKPRQPPAAYASLSKISSSLRCIASHCMPFAARGITSYVVFIIKIYYCNHHVGLRIRNEVQSIADQSDFAQALKRFEGRVVGRRLGRHTIIGPRPVIASEILADHRQELGPCARILAKCAEHLSLLAAPSNLENI